MNKQLTETLNKVNPWSDRIKTSHLTPKEAYVGAQTTIFKTIQYALPATSFSESQSRKIESALYQNLLGKLNMSTKLPLEYRYGPHKFQGAALLKVYVFQLIAKLSIFLHYANLKTQLGNIYLASMEAMMIEIGSTTHFFSLPFPDYSHLTPVSWCNTPPQ